MDKSHKAKRDNIGILVLTDLIVALSVAVYIGDTLLWVAFGIETVSAILFVRWVSGRFLVGKMQAPYLISGLLLISTILRSICFYTTLIGAWNMIKTTIDLVLHLAAVGYLTYSWHSKTVDDNFQSLATR